MNILMLYNYVPGTTAWYLEWALRKYHSVKTCGTCSTGSSHHDIPLHGSYIRVDELYKRLSKSWQIDAFIMVDSAYTFFPRGITSLPIPTIFYAIDTHLAFQLHKIIASLFDLVFVAQKEFVEPLNKTGCPNTFWLPLACEPDIHHHYDLPKIYDVCFLGSLHPQRKSLLKRLSHKFKVYQGYRPFNEVTKFYSQSKIIFNKSINNDLNMRIFEAMCSGSLLLTDRLVDNGLEDLFEDRRHLVLYDDDNLEYLTQYYLTHESERERIAAEGRDCVINNHTYQHRAKQMLEAIEEFISRGNYIRNKRNELLRFIKIWFLQSRFSKLFRYAD